jgi:hypothetical protein
MPFGQQIPRLLLYSSVSPFQKPRISYPGVQGKKNPSALLAAAITTMG